MDAPAEFMDMQRRFNFESINWLQFGSLREVDLTSLFAQKNITRIEDISVLSELWRRHQRADLRSDLRSVLREVLEPVKAGVETLISKGSSKDGSNLSSDDLDEFHVEQLALEDVVDMMTLNKPGRTELAREYVSYVSKFRPPVVAAAGAGSRGDKTNNNTLRTVTAGAGIASSSAATRNSTKKKTQKKQSSIKECGNATSVRQSKFLVSSPTSSTIDVRRTSQGGVSPALERRSRSSRREFSVSLVAESTPQKISAPKRKNARPCKEKEKRETPKGDEKSIVQPRTQEFLENWFQFDNELIPSKEEVDNKYVLERHDVRIKGYADFVVVYHGIVLGSWEDKSSFLDLGSPPCQAQILSEVEAFALKFSARHGNQPQFCGVLNNGNSISFVLRHFRSSSGTVLRFISRPLPTTQENLDIILQGLHGWSCIIQTLREVVDFFRLTSTLGNLAVDNDDDETPSETDEGEDYFDEDQGHGHLKSQKPQHAARTQQSPVNGKQVLKSKSSSKSSSAGQRRSLATLNMNLRLTAESLKQNSAGMFYLPKEVSRWS